MSKEKTVETVTVIVDKENGVEAHYLGDSPPTGLQYVYVQGVETGQAITRKHLERQTTEDGEANNNYLTSDHNDAETTWQDVTNTKKEYFETFHEYGDKLKEGIILKKIEVNAANTLNYRLTVLDINQENDEGNKETTEVIINIDWKKGTETQEIASETIYTRNINQETDKVEETGQPVIAVHLNKQPNENVEADATASSIPDHIAISYANPLATLMVDRNDGNGYTEVSNNDVFVGTKEW